MSLSTKIELSPAEEILFNHFGIPKGCWYDPTSAWRLMAQEAFLLNQNSSQVDAVRRGLGAVINCKPYRLTPEFEKLIEVNENC